MCSSDLDKTPTMCELGKRFANDATYARLLETSAYQKQQQQQEQRRQQHQKLVDALESIERATLDMFRDTETFSREDSTMDVSETQSFQSEDKKLPPNSAGNLGGYNAESGDLPDCDASALDTSLDENDQECETDGASRRKRKRSSRSNVKDPNSTLKGHKRSFVEHHYHDLSQEPETNDDEAPASKNRGGITTPFPMQLYEMLQHADIRGFDNIVAWQPHGRSFLVHDPQRFVAEVMPMFFRQTRMSSFQRQLSLYGFLRLTRKGPDHGSYYHEMFLRGMPRLCRRMQRTRVKGYRVRQSSSPDTEPDFSTMPIVGQRAQRDFSYAALPVFPQNIPVAGVGSGFAASTTLDSSIPWLAERSGPTNDNNNKVGPLYAPQNHRDAFPLSPDLSTMVHNGVSSILSMPFHEAQAAPQPLGGFAPELSAMPELQLGAMSEQQEQQQQRVRAMQQLGHDTQLEWAIQQASTSTSESSQPAIISTMVSAPRRDEHSSYSPAHFHRTNSQGTYPLAFPSAVQQQIRRDRKSVV